MEFLSLLKEISVPTIFIVVGLLLMFISIGVRPSNKFVNFNVKPIFSSILSITLIVTGVLIQILPSININTKNLSLPIEIKISELQDQSRIDYKEKKYNSAINKLKEALIHYPNDVWTLKKLAQSYKQNDQYKSALASINRAISIEIENGDLYQEKASIYAFKQDHKKALKYYKKSFSINNDNISLLGNMSTYARLSKDNKASLDYINRKIKIEPYVSYNYYLRGLTYQAMKKYDLAISSYEKNIKIDPEGYYAKYSRIQIDKIKNKQ